MKKKQALFAYGGIALGTLFVALGLQLFLVPGKLSPGGISSLATILFHLFGVPLSITNLVVNAALFALGFRFLLRATILRTVAGVLLSSLFLSFRMPLFFFISGYFAYRKENAESAIKIFFNTLFIFHPL